VTRRELRSVKHRVGVAAAVVALVTVIAPATTQAQSEAEAGSTPVRAALDRLLAEGVPGAVLFTRDDDHTLTVAAGVADLSTGRPMRPNLRFRAGSVTKTFVATVALQLVGEGALSLSDTVEHWLPALVPGGDAISVRQLLNHTSGLFDYLDDPRTLDPYLAGQLDFRWRPRQLVRIATSHPPLFPPGAAWSYSNTGYILLGMIIEAATGHRLAAELDRRVIRPLHLSSTSFDVGTTIEGPHAHGYTLLGADLTDVTVLSQSWAWAAGALVSTADDLGIFLSALLGGRLLTPALLDQMEDTVPLGVPGEGYGLGLWRTASFFLPPDGQLSCGRVWGHDGDTVGYRTFAFASRDGRRQAVLLLNVDGSSVPPSITPAVVDVMEAALCG
jgi:D-alanyl-D-alanine carboxypeptidase